MSYQKHALGNVTKYTWYILFLIMILSLISRIPSAHAQPDIEIYRASGDIAYLGEYTPVRPTIGENYTIVFDCTHDYSNGIHLLFTLYTPDFVYDDIAFIDEGQTTTSFNYSFTAVFELYTPIVHGWGDGVDFTLVVYHHTNDSSSVVPDYHTTTDSTFPLGSIITLGSLGTISVVAILLLRFKLKS